VTSAAVIFSILFVLGTRVLSPLETTFWQEVSATESGLWIEVRFTT